MSNIINVGELRRENDKFVAENERLRKVLLDCKEYIESAEETIDGEWGRCRNIIELIEQNAMPKLYNDVCEILKEG